MKNGKIEAELEESLRSIHTPVSPNRNDLELIIEEK
jgi:hypothetical protein